MHTFPRRCFLWILFLALFQGVPLGVAQQASPSPTRAIPEALRLWQDWALWDDVHRNCPTPYNDADQHLCFWPGRLSLSVDAAGGRFDFEATVFSEAWIPLPGGTESWPVEVKLNGAPAPVMDRNGGPMLRVAPGTHRIEGLWKWNAIPQRLAVPPAIGVIALAIDGNPVPFPLRDGENRLWLKRDATSGEADRDAISAKVYSVLQDGIPMWFRSEIELIVSGKSREETIGNVLPEGWKLAAVQSGGLPVAVDAAGNMKAQVRAGRWTIRLDAFRVDNAAEIRFADAAKPAAPEQILAFQSQPDLRMIELTGLPSVDVAQTTMPDRWRALPVFRWDTSETFRIEERMRGSGSQKPGGLSIDREWWLDESGRAFTFRDRIRGGMQEIWRLDAVAGQDLGSVRERGVGQLLTRNRELGMVGVEVRSREIDLEATGRMQRAPSLAAGGWNVDAEQLRVSLELPPGWRLFALFGADWVRGDWLTSWTLLDLFLLLLFSLAVARLWGALPGLLAFAAFGLAYHEPGAARYAWLVLLPPLALLRAVSAGWGRRILLAWKWIAVLALVCILAPFLQTQVQNALYPQLESLPGRASRPMDFVAGQATPASANADAAATAAIEAKLNQSLSSAPASVGLSVRSPRISKQAASDQEARIQTGPGVPEWNWREVEFGWSGPVLASHRVRPILISRGLEAGLCIARVVLLLALAGVLLRGRSGRAQGPGPAGPPAAVVAALLVMGCFVGAMPARAEMPDKATLDLLRKRLLQTSEPTPVAADIPSATLSIKDRALSLEAEVHTATRTAVPLPGRLPGWSPLGVTVDGKPETAVLNRNGFLWVVLAPGVHRVRVDGLLPDVADWEWTFQLKPRRVTVDAPDWNVTGVRADGTPESQVLFSRKQKVQAGEATYDRQEFETVAAVERRIDLGLVWRVTTTVQRLSPPGKAVSLRIPLLPGERVVSPEIIVKDGAVEAQLGARQGTLVWESELATAETLRLETRAGDSWVERWRLVASPLWSIGIRGLAPTFEQGRADLEPVWRPWPGEHAELVISRPEALAGATTTIMNATHSETLGKRQRLGTLALGLRTSLGGDFVVRLPAGSEITGLRVDDREIPARIEDGRLVIPVRPGDPKVHVAWKSADVLGARARMSEIQLPAAGTNIHSSLAVPENRWVLWANGPQRGPAVQFWSVLLGALLGAGILGRLRVSPLRTWEWMLLAIGLTQVPLLAALAVVAWFFLLVWRGSDVFPGRAAWRWNLAQVLVIGSTVGALSALVAAVAHGLLGSPEMFIAGNGSSGSLLRWYLDRCEKILPRPGCVSVSIWWYRFLMLAWALWLAAALVRWLGWAWGQFSRGGCFRPIWQRRRPVAGPPPMPPSAG